MNEKKLYIFMYCSWLALAVAVWFCLSSRGVRDNGAGASAIGKQLESAGQSAAAITERIEKAEQRADSLRERARRIESIVVSTGDTIKDSQSILAGIRRRGKVETVKD